jgi:hypothetical protein
VASEPKFVAQSTRCGGHFDVYKYIHLTCFACAMN